MKLTNEMLFKEFHEEIIKEYPNLKLEDIIIICSTTWKFLREEMDSGRLTKIRFKYFGVFQAYPKRVEYTLSQLNKRLEKGLITKKYYLYTKDKLETYLKTIKKND